MTYEVVWTKPCIKRLKKLPVEIVLSIKNKVESIKDNPYNKTDKLHKINAYRLKCGDYRAIIDIKDPEKTINVLTVGHRKNIYKKI
jgi:mRNA interferase RelE/StbE